MCFILLETISFCTKHLRLKHPIGWWGYKFLKMNFYTCDGAYKKFVRLFDTLGSFFGLAGLMLGLFSVLCDQYDLEFEFEGELKSFADGLNTYTSKIKSVVDQVKRIIKSIDFNITCEAIYSTIATGTLSGLVLSIIPGTILSNNLVKPWT